MKNGVPYKDQNVYVKINIYLNQASTFPFRPLYSCHYIEASSQIFGANQWNGFYTMATMD